MAAWVGIGTFTSERRAVGSAPLIITNALGVGMGPSMLLGWAWGQWAKSKRRIDGSQ